MISSSIINNIIVDLSGEVSLVNSKLHFLNTIDSSLSINMLLSIYFLCVVIKMKFYTYEQFR